MNSWTFPDFLSSLIRSGNQPLLALIVYCMGEIITLFTHQQRDVKSNNNTLIVQCTSNNNNNCHNAVHLITTIARACITTTHITPPTTTDRKNNIVIAETAATTTTTTSTCNQRIAIARSACWLEGLAEKRTWNGNRPTTARPLTAAASVFQRSKRTRKHWIASKNFLTNPHKQQQQQQLLSRLSHSK